MGYTPCSARYKLCNQCEYIIHFFIHSSATSTVAHCSVMLLPVQYRMDPAMSASLFNGAIPPLACEYAMLVLLQ